jgi:hypothetical protein
LIRQAIWSCILPPPKLGGPPVTNIRNTSSPHWRGWLKPENRCLVPANSFSEYAPEPNPLTKKKDVVWFALNEDRPLFAFAGIWTEFKGDRGTKSKPIPGPHNVYGFLTTSPNSIVEPIHPKDPDHGRGARRLDARAMGRGKGIAAAPARRRAQDRHARHGKEDRAGPASSRFQILSTAIRERGPEIAKTLDRELVLVVNFGACQET